jgi:uridine kinase
MEIDYLRKHGKLRPMNSHLVGIAGGTASGKTTLTRRLLELSSSLDPGVVELDGYYRCQDSVSLEKRALVNYDHPNAFEFELLASHLEDLRRGRGVDVPVYDFALHNRNPNKINYVKPSPVVFVEGILTLAIPILRPLFDTMIFVSAPDEVRLSRRIERDVRERGRTEQGVQEQWSATVQPMHLEYCSPSEQFAHLVVDGTDLSTDQLNKVWDFIFARVNNTEKNCTVSPA